MAEKVERFVYDDAIVRMFLLAILHEDEPATPRAPGRPPAPRGSRP